MTEVESWHLPPDVAANLVPLGPIPGLRLVADGDDYLLVRDVPVPAGPGYTMRVSLGDTERPPLPRAHCYYCKAHVSDGRCTACEQRQPE